MDSKIKEVIRQILAIVNYQEDKETFILRIEKECCILAAADLLNRLSPERRKVYLQKLHDGQGLDEFKADFFEFFSQEVYSKAMEDALTRVLKSFTENLYQKLSEPEKTNLQKYLLSLAY
jgi:hypothetical protein